MTLPGVVFTTSVASAKDNKRRPWIRFLLSRELAPDRHYVFTDGSSLGACAAVLLTPGEAGSQAASKWSVPTATRNVGAEWRGLLLGLNLAPAGVHLTVVCDLLWVHAQLIGVRKTHDPETKVQLAEAHELIRSKDFKSLQLVHHAGHQRDDSLFSYWNNKADSLCSAANKVAKAAQEAGAKP